VAIEERVQYALDKILNPQYFDAQKECYELLENDKLGRARILLNVGTSDNICVKNYDSVPPWAILREERKFHMRKSIDHFILRKISDVWELHMIEIKKTINPSVWRDLKLQMRSAYFSIKALTTFLGINISDENIFVYTAYGNEQISSESEFDTVTTKTFKVGIPYFDPKIEWNKQCIHIPLIDDNGEEKFVKFKHIKIEMSATPSGILESSFDLNV
jgi:hypothetical protein